MTDLIRPFSLMDADFAGLLRFAELIQARLKVETKESVKSSLRKDLKKVKDEIGKIILEMPTDASIQFPDPPDDTIPQIEEVQKIQERAEVETDESFDSDYSRENSATVISSDDMAAKFDAFLKSKANKPKVSRPRSRIPVPQNKQ